MNRSAPRHETEISAKENNGMSPKALTLGIPANQE
jgi:hypothetical protein